jgi:hypothetical protein
MKRKSNKQPDESKSTGNNNGHGGIFISKQTLDTILRQKTRHVADMIALLNFYHYTALWQNTNQPCASLEYVAKGLKWGRNKARAVRSLLLKLGFVEHVRTVDDQTNKVTGWYIRLPYFHPTENQEGGATVPVLPPVAKSTPNALRSVSINALRSVKPPIAPQGGRVCRRFRNGAKPMSMAHRNKMINRLNERKARIIRTFPDGNYAQWATEELAKIQRALEKL